MVRQHGDGAAVFIAERIGALALKNDTAGMQRWIEIARRVAWLMSNQTAGNA